MNKVTSVVGRTKTRGNGPLRARLRHATRLLVRLTGVAVLGLNGQAFASSLDIGAMAPNFTLKSVTGENLRLGEHAGDVRAVIFTASWCGSCNDALRALQALHPTMEKYGYRSWAIHLDQEPGKARDLSRQLGLTYPVLLDSDGQVARRYWIDDLPALFLIDRDGRIRDVLEGDDVRNTVRIADTLKRIAEE